MSTTTAFGWREVIEEAAAIARAGGDPHSCHRGPFCPRCCIALAKGALDKRHGTAIEEYTDWPLEAARDQLRLAGDTGDVLHTQESVLALFTKVLEAA